MLVLTDAARGEHDAQPPAVEDGAVVEDVEERHPPPVALQQHERRVAHVENLGRHEQPGDLR